MKKTGKKTVKTPLKRQENRKSEKVKKDYFLLMEISFFRVTIQVN